MALFAVAAARRRRTRRLVTRGRSRRGSWRHGRTTTLLQVRIARSWLLLRICRLVEGASPPRRPRQLQQEEEEEEKGEACEEQRRTRTATALIASAHFLSLSGVRVAPFKSTAGRWYG